MFKSRKPSREPFLSAGPQQPYSSSYYDRSSIISSSEEDVPQTRGRAGTLPAHNVKRRPATANDGVRPTRLQPLTETLKDTNESRSRRRPEAEIPAPQANPAPALHLRPLYAEQLSLDPDGHVISGTLEALVEKLTSDYPSLDASSEFICACFQDVSSLPDAGLRNGRGNYVSQCLFDHISHFHDR